MLLFQVWAWRRSLRLLNTLLVQFTMDLTPDQFLFYGFIHLHLSEVCWVQLQVQASAPDSLASSSLPPPREISFSFIWNPAKHKHRTGILSGYTGCPPAMTTIQISSERNHSLRVLTGWIGCVLLQQNDLESSLLRGSPLCQAAWINKHSCEI